MRETIVIIRTIDVHIGKLREKVGKSKADLIETVRGVGGIDLWLINRIREKMIRNWVVLNTGISIFVIGPVGLSIKELACHQSHPYVHSTIESEQFRQVLGKYLIDAGILAFAISVLGHFFFAKKNSVTIPLPKML